jgi:hypothetical protein
MGALLLVGCAGSGSGGFAPQGKVQTTDHISGKGVPWNEGTGYQLVAVANDNGKLIDLGSAPIAADGSYAFAAPLTPPPATLLTPSDITNDHSEPECTSKPTRSTTPIKTTGIEFIVRDSAGTGREAAAGLQFFYSDGEATLIGKSICPTHGGAVIDEVDFDIHAVAGFNVIDLHNVGGDPHHGSISTIDLPSPLQLVADPL